MRSDTEPGPMPLTWVAAAIRAEVADLRRQLMTAKAREGVERIAKLAEQIDFHTHDNGESNA